MDPDDTQYPAASQQCKDIREQMRDMALMILSSMNGIAAAWVTSMGFAQAKALMDSRYKVEGLTYNIVSALSTPAPEAALLVTPAAVPPFFSLPGTKSHALSSATDSSSTPPLVKGEPIASPATQAPAILDPSASFLTQTPTTLDHHGTDDVVLSGLSDTNNLEVLKIHYWPRSRGGSALHVRKETLTDLVFDMSASQTGDQNLQRPLLICLACSGLRNLEYHAHTEETKFEAGLLKKPWNLPHLETLQVYGLVQSTVPFEVT
ncbi:hypothetical protein BGX23_003436 [Mortierella sp. AD031]|nr:hypothetical protein BGX23_003436 [Mortierella sp. AD031]